MFKPVYQKTGIKLSKKYNLNLDTEKISKIFSVFLVIYACFANFKIVHMYI
jgi:hypothetical protein